MSTLKIRIPNFYKNEQLYVIDILLGEFLGLNFKVETHEKNLVEITRENIFDKSLKLTLDTSFFSKAREYWLEEKSMPNLHHTRP